MWILFGGLLGTIMWFNVWFVIWPRQKKILGAMLGGPAAPAEAAPQAALASKINTYLSGPMLWGMIAASHVNIWPMKIATLGLPSSWPGPDPRPLRDVAQGEDDGLTLDAARTKLRAENWPRLYQVRNPSRSHHPPRHLSLRQARPRAAPAARSPARAGGRACAEGGRPVAHLTPMRAEHPRRGSAQTRSRDAISTSRSSSARR